MLEGMTSRQVAEWRAFEVINGQIGQQYTNEMLAQLNELLQNTNILVAQAKDKPRHVPRPWEDPVALEEQAEEETFGDRDAVLNALDAAIPEKEAN